MKVNITTSYYELVNEATKPSSIDIVNEILEWYKANLPVFPLLSSHRLEQFCSHSYRCHHLYQ